PPPTCTRLPYTTLFRSDLPFLVRVEESDGPDGGYVAGKFLTAADLPAGVADGDAPDSENAQFKTVLLDARTGRPVVPGGSLGHQDRKSTRLNSSHVKIS